MGNTSSGTYGKASLRNQLSPEQIQALTSFFTPMAQAIKTQENDPTGKFGVRSISTSNPSQVLGDSIYNNYARWALGMTPAPWIQNRPEKFVDFMQQRWAPIGAENDPKGLNKNWAPGVRSILKQLIGEEQYKELERLNIVKGSSQPNAV